MAKDPIDRVGKGSSGGVTKHQGLASGKMKSGSSLSGIKGSAGRPAGSATMKSSGKNPYTGKKC